MRRSSVCLTVLGVFVLGYLLMGTSPGTAQIPGEVAAGKDDVGLGSPPPEPPPGMDLGRFQRRRQVPTERFEDLKKQQARREKMQRLRTTAEAHKNLAELYAKQDKIDPAIAELRKILTLAEEEEKDEQEQGQGPMITQKIAQVYMQMSELLFKAQRFQDAETILNEGADKIAKKDPHGSARLLLHLGNMMQRQGRSEEAERAFKKVIELNAESPK